MMDTVEINVSTKVLFTFYLRVWIERMAVIVVQDIFKKPCYAPFKAVLCQKTWQRGCKIWMIIYWVRFYYHD